MGQYYILANLDKKQVMSPHDGLVQRRPSKYRTASNIAYQLDDLGVKPMLALALIATRSCGELPNPLWGSWAEDRIVLIGDYSQDLPDFLTEVERTELQLQRNLYHFCKEEYLDMAEDWEAWFKAEERLEEVVPAHSRHVFVNSDKNEFLDPVTFGSHRGFVDFLQDRHGVLAALFSCLFYSTGAGAGDIAAFKKGRWDGDHLKFVALSEAYSADCKDVSHEVNKLLSAYQ